MMFNKYIALLALPILAAATPMPGGEPTTKPATTSTVTVTAPASTSTQPASQCNTGDLQCCNSVQQSDSSSLSGILGLLGVVLQGVAIPVGVTCDPISVIGIGGNSCSAQPVCCENNSFNGLIALGCTPVNLSL